MLTHEEIRAIYDRGPEAVIAAVEQLCVQIAELTTRVKELEDRLATTSRNSSKPPSRGRRPRERRLGKWGGDFKADFKRPEVSLSHETYLRCTPVAHEATRDGVGLGHPVERFLARTDRCNGRWDGRQLAMMQDARDHRLVGNSGNDPQRATAAKGTGGHS